jgi:phosphatidylglycerol:prolipoprotein diacylglycerol transferase
MEVACYGLLIGRSRPVGNFMNVEAYGERDAALAHGERGCRQRGDNFMEVHPTFSMSRCGTWLFLLHILGKKVASHATTDLLAVYHLVGVGRSMIEGLRTDALYFFGLTFFGSPIRTSQCSHRLAVAALLS